MQKQEIETVIRRAYGAFATKERHVIEELMSEKLAFTSPYDDRIGKAEYMERCWPNSGRIARHHIERIFVEGDEAFVRYEIETVDGERWRNVEWFRCDGGKIVEVEVYFGSPAKAA